jgi:hypothetical protein
METETFRRVGTADCEIVGPDGVIAWAMDLVWAVRIVALLNGAEEGSLTPACSNHLTTT